MPFSVVRNDITKMRVDAIVNAANTKLKAGGGVCGAIFKAAGEKELKEACDRIPELNVGEAAITPGFGLKSKYIIHAAGPVYSANDPNKSERELRNAYINSLKLAEENNCESIAFPLISSGIYVYPKAEALRVATEAIKEYLKNSELNVFLVIFDKEAFVLSEALSDGIKSYIDENYVSSHTDKRRNMIDVECDAIEAINAPPSLPKSASVFSRATYEQALSDEIGLDSLIEKLDEPFSDTLLKLIDVKGMTDVEVYKRANIDRKLFSKIRTGKGYTPGKRTVVALAIALRLDLGETDNLLKKAGFALSHSKMFDVIVEYFIVNSNYDIFEINEVLFKYDQPLLGA